MPLGERCTTLSWSWTGASPGRQPWPSSEGGGGEDEAQAAQGEAAEMNFILKQAGGPILGGITPAPNAQARQVALAGRQVLHIHLQVNRFIALTYFMCAPSPVSHQV